MEVRFLLVPKLLKLGRLLRRPALWGPLISTGTAAGVEHIDMIRMLDPMTLIDVGANKGQFALAVRYVSPGARLIAFEPLPAAAETFERLFGNDPAVALHRTAIADYTGTADFYITDRQDSSSLLKPGKGQEEAFGVSAAEMGHVPVCPLDEIIDPKSLDHPVLLKIDVQGAELQVLLGAKEILPMVDYVYVEASFVELYHSQPLFSDVDNFMKQYGYRLRGVFNQASTPSFGPTQADFLFSRA